MARIRTIKPELFLNEELAELQIYARMLFIGLFTQADRRGRMEDRPRRLKAALFPYDDIDVDDLLSSLHSAGFIIRYECEGVRLIQVANFEKHQRFTGDEAKSESKYPEYQPVTRYETDEKQERNNQETLEKPGREGKGKERKGNKQQQQHAREQLENVVEEHRGDLNRLFPKTDVPVAVEKLLHHFRESPLLLDPWMTALKWFQREFKTPAVAARASPTGQKTKGGLREDLTREILAANAAACRDFCQEGSVNAG